MKRHIGLIALVAILLLATGLRFYQLDAQSLWNDEGNSARIAERTPALIVAGARGDIHPPGYYLLLHVWRAFCGQTEFALRSLSAIAGVALVALTYRLGRRLFDRATGLAAALLSAMSPLAVTYSQEARMYALLATLGAASTCVLVAWLDAAMGADLPGDRRANRIVLPVSYVLLGAAGLYTQYTFPFVLLVHNAVFAVWWLKLARTETGGWRRLIQWAAAQLAIGTLYLPWLQAALKSLTGWSPAGRGYSLLEAALDVARVLTVGVTLPIESAIPAITATGLFIALGILPTPLRVGFARSRADSEWHGVWVPLTYLALPIGLILALDLYKPAWLKFLVVVLPPLHLMAGLGLRKLVQASGYTGDSAITPAQRVLRGVAWVLGLALLLVPLGPSLHNLYFEPVYARDNYRGIARDITAFWKPGDAIILNAPNQWEVFTYYFRERDVYPTPYHPTPQQADTFLSSVSVGRRRLFVLYWGDAESDPTRLIENWLTEHAYSAADHWYGNVRVTTYGLAPLPDEPQRELDARFGEAIRLRGYSLTGDRFEPGDILPITLYWESMVPVSERYKVTVQLLDSGGVLRAQRDAEPGNGLYPTTEWAQSATTIDRLGVQLPPDLATDDYSLVVGMYHISSGERLPVAGRTDHVRLGTVTVR